MIAEDLEDLGLLEVEAEGTHRDLELVVIDTAVFVCVEELKRLFDLLFLLVGELWPRVGATLGFLGSCGAVHCVGRVCGVESRGDGVAKMVGRGRHE